MEPENGNAFTIAVMQTVRGLLGDEVEKDLTAWVKSRAEAIRQPVDVQYSGLERELPWRPCAFRRYRASRLDLAKLNRRREVIEERLKKLETLRAADPQSLLRNRGNI